MTCCSISELHLVQQTPRVKFCLSYGIAEPNVLDVKQMLPPDNGTVVNVEDAIQNERSVANVVEQVRVRHQYNHVHWR